MPDAFFSVTARDRRARTGLIRTAHGNVETPAFMPVGTQGTVKALDVRDLNEAGAEIILGNTYHLHLRPGEDRVATLGGLHAFMGWGAPLLTDSGGFQVFSLDGEKTNTHASRVYIDEDGVTFRSHIDGSEHRFTPESAIEMQQKIGADIIMTFDQCTKDDVPERVAREAMNRTHRWAERCIEYQQKNKGPHAWPQYLFGIIQGGPYETLRRESARVITDLPFDGIAIGGESIGYNREATARILDWIVETLPEEKPRYTMGVGVSPADIFAVVERGIDMFDCVAPTRMARNGTVFLSPLSRVGEGRGEGRINHRLDLTRSIYLEDARPIDAWCTCNVCKGFVLNQKDGSRTPPTTRAYLHHLFRANELLAYRLASIHNVHFMLQLMHEIREAIRTQRFTELKEAWRTVK